MTGGPQGKSKNMSEAEHSAARESNALRCMLRDQYVHVHEYQPLKLYACLSEVAGCSNDCRRRRSDWSESHVSCPWIPSLKLLDDSLKWTEFVFPCGPRQENMLKWPSACDGFCRNGFAGWVTF